MVPIIEEVTAALLAFCSAVASRAANSSPAGQTSTTSEQEVPARTAAHVVDERGKT